MRWALLAASVAAAAISSNGAFAQDAKREPAAQQSSDQREPSAAPATTTAAALRVTSPPNVAADRTYDTPQAALLQADIDYLVREGHRAVGRDEADGLWYAAAFADDLAAGRYADARAVLRGAPGGIDGSFADMLEPFLIAAEGNVDRAVERVDSGGDNLPQPLPEVARALLFESAGRLPEAAAVYALMVERLDTTPPGDAEPQTSAEFDRALNAARVTHSVYRAALVSHRLGRTADARRYYNIVLGFAPRAVDVQANLARLDAGQAPFEQPLTVVGATGRWMLFISEFVTQAETLQAMIAQRDPEAGLASESGTALLQIGTLLANDSDDWRLYAAQQALDAGGVDGAQRIIDQVPATSPFAPDAEIVRASIQIERGNDAAAAASAERALSLAGSRWSIIASVGDVYRRIGHPDRAIPAFDRALTMTQDAKDRADVLGWRAYAHRFSGNLSAASADVREAYRIDPSVDTRLLYVSILMDDPAAWGDGVAMARSLFAEQPDSVMRLNALGYALIQRPEGLEEGYRLLWRGFNFGQTDYSVIDSLGWAYYLYGHFDQARALIERANDLSGNNPNAEILDHLGDVYWRLNRRDDARATWRRAIEARPDAIRRRDIEQKLSRGLTVAAPRQRALPQVSLPEGPAQRDEL
ncbi:MAG: tetratricopeptide repeat protein [Hyphomonadaceae bacterium]|nr:tetratricopeptide repeat protein [Hyphomonadaceae bacterium]